MMKHICLLLLFALFITGAAAQSFTLTVAAPYTHADTLHLQNIKRVKITDANQRFEGEIIYKDVAATAFSSRTVLKMKKGLEAGYYRVTADTTLLFELLVSEKKKQKTVVTIGRNGEVSFEGSDENEQYQQYLLAKNRLSRSMDSLDRIFQQARNTMPQYMLQDLAVRLSAEAGELITGYKTLCQQMSEKMPGTLLASIIQFETTMPTMPPNVTDNEQYLAYNALHAFDGFPYDDGRMCTTPTAMYRLLTACSNLFYTNPKNSPAIADTLLTRCQANADNYHAFFTVMERAFGTIGISFWTEEIYLVMLRNALAYPQLEEQRRVYYQQLYELQSKNLPGTQLPDIPILWSDSTRSSLYDVKSEYTLLYLQNPDCHTCTAVRAQLEANADLQQAVRSGRLTVVTLYFEKDEALWRRYLKTKANPQWRHGWDYQNTIDAGNLFDLRAIPVIFLLDKEKRVLRKNIAHYEISQALREYHILP